MRTKFTSLLIIWGGVLGAFTYSFFPFSIVALILGGLLLGMSFMLFSSVYSGTVWGVRIKSTIGGKLAVLFSTIGLIFGGYALVLTVIACFSALSKIDIIGIVVNIIAYVVPLAVGPFIAKTLAEKCIIAKSNNAQVLGELAIFKEIDANIGEATHFVVGFEGVALFSSTNYCYAVYPYQNYQLGDLSTPQEVAMVGTYFVQKYHDTFTFKVDAEVIPGEPGQTAVAVGTGGIAVARTAGTADQRIFRSYIFTKKQK